MIKGNYTIRKSEISDSFLSRVTRRYQKNGVTGLDPLDNGTHRGCLVPLERVNSLPFYQTHCPGVPFRFLGINSGPFIIQVILFWFHSFSSHDLYSSGKHLISVEGRAKKSNVDHNKIEGFSAELFNSFSLP